MGNRCVFRGAAICCGLGGGDQERRGVQEGWRREGRSLMRETRASEKHSEIAAGRGAKRSDEEICYTVCSELSWSHYRHLMRIGDPHARRK